MELWTALSGPRQTVGGMGGGGLDGVMDWREKKSSNNILQPQQNTLTFQHARTNRLSSSELHLFLVSVDVDEVERENVVLGSDQQPPSLLVQ